MAKLSTAPHPVRGRQTQRLKVGVQHLGKLSDWIKYGGVIDNRFKARMQPCVPKNHLKVIYSSKPNALPLTPYRPVGLNKITVNITIKGPTKEKGA